MLRSQKKCWRVRRFRSRSEYRVPHFAPSSHLWSRFLVRVGVCTWLLLTCVLFSQERKRKAGQIVELESIWDKNRTSLFEERSEERKQAQVRDSSTRERHCGSVNGWGGGGPSPLGNRRKQYRGIGMRWTAGSVRGLNLFRWPHPMLNTTSDGLREFALPIFCWKAGWPHVNLDYQTEHGQDTHSSNHYTSGLKGCQFIVVLDWRWRTQWINIPCHLRP